MTEPGAPFTVDAPIGAAPSPPPGEPVARVFAVIGGALVLLVGGLFSLGGVLVGALGVGIGFLVAGQRGRPLTRLASWIYAVVTTGIVLVVAGALLYTKLPPEVVDQFKAAMDSASAAQRSMTPAADSGGADAGQGPAAGPVKAIATFVGLYLAASIIALLYGTIGWGGTLLLRFGVTGRWIPTKGQA
jgi:hypothetical protein